MEERLAEVMEGFRGTRGEAVDVICEKFQKSRATAYRYLDRVAEPLKAAFEVLADMTRKLRAQGHAVTRLDLGGGLGVPYSGGT